MTRTEQRTERLEAVRAEQLARQVARANAHNAERQAAQ